MKSLIDKHDDVEYTGIVIDAVIETTSGDLCFEYNIVSGGVREDVSKYIVVAANCVWLDLVVTGNEVGAKKQQQSIWRGYAILPEGELKKRGTFDEVQAIDVNQPRNLRKKVVKTDIITVTAATESDV